jgi:hypothetical protein
LPSVRIARPFVQNKHSCKIGDIAELLQEFLGQVVQRRSRITGVERSQMLSTVASNVVTGKTDSQLWRVLNEPN